jgi:prevent-host-death family protein
MEEVGLREMRQHASDLVRRAQGGERLTITVAGRPAAMLGPIHARVWRHWDELSEIFALPPDPAWAEVRDVLDQSIADPWAEG